ncbi:MAG: hypothetical protein KUG81_06410, partial [Gammaproteobacteria bacterium]|nr:hypothetical protein [Gammaproteobacteria bacterium]
MKHWIIITVTLGVCLTLATQIATAQEVIDNEPGYWADNPPIEFVDQGWKSWPTWEGDPPTPVEGPITCPIPSPITCPISLPIISPDSSKSKKKIFDINSTSITKNSDNNWEIEVASWNLLNFTESKAYFNSDTNNPRTGLLNRIAQKASPYSIIFFQEIRWRNQNIFPPPLEAAMKSLGGYDACSLTTPAVGWGASHMEYYGYCYKRTVPTIHGNITITPGFGRSTACAQNMPDPVGSANSFCGQEIWIRPPGVVTFNIQPPKDNAVDFTFYNMHAKPAYNKNQIKIGKSNKLPAWYPDSNPIPHIFLSWPKKNSSVYYELDALQTYLSNVPGNPGNIIILGDLNSDGPTFPYLQKTYASQHSKALKGPNWNWSFGSGEYTNVGKIRSQTNNGITTWTGNPSKTYDQFILNNSSQAYHISDGIETNGIADKIN